MAKGSSGVVLLGLAAVAVGAVVLSKGSAAAQPAPGGTGGAAPGPMLPAGCQLDANLPPALAQQILAALNTPGTSASTFTQLSNYAKLSNFPLAAACLAQSAAKVSASGGIFTGLHSSAVLGAAAKSIGMNKSPVDWSTLDVAFVNNIASLKQQGFSSADALAIAQLMQQGMTQAQAVAKIQQAAVFQMPIQPLPAPAAALSTWQQQAQNQLMLIGWSAPSAFATAKLLPDAQARYLVRSIKHGVDPNTALVTAQAGASDLAAEWSIESALTPSQRKALNTLIVNAWEADNITTPRVSADRPPTPSQERQVTQLAAKLTGQKADFFNQLISTGSGVREAYTQMTGDSDFPKA